MSFYFAVLLLLFFAIAVVLVLQAFRFVKAFLRSSKKPAATKQKKQVRFSPDVKIAHAGGKKKDRFNPDLKDCVMRNSSMALQAGGAKHLAQLSLSSV